MNDVIFLYSMSHWSIIMIVLVYSICCMWNSHCSFSQNKIITLKFKLQPHFYLSFPFISEKMRWSRILWSTVLLILLTSIDSHAQSSAESTDAPRFPWQQRYPDDIATSQRDNQDYNYNRDGGFSSYGAYRPSTSQNENVIIKEA